MVGTTNSHGNSTLRYECDETLSDECEFAARAEGEWCNHTCQENVFSHEYRTKFYITRCESADFRTRSVRKTAFTHLEWYKSVIISGTIFCSWDYYSHTVKSITIILYYISGWNRYKKKLSPQGNIKYSEKHHIFYYILYFPEETTIKNSCPFIVTNTIYFSQCNRLSL